MQLLCKSIIFDSLDNRDIIKSIFGQFVMLPALQRKIVVLLYKNPDISINELKELSNIKTILSGYENINATVIERNRNYWFNTIKIDKAKSTRYIDVFFQSIFWISPCN